MMLYFVIYLFIIWSVFTNLKVGFGRYEMMYVYNLYFWKLNI